MYRTSTAFLLSILLLVCVSGERSQNEVIHVTTVRFLNFNKIGENLRNGWNKAKRKVTNIQRRVKKDVRKIGRKVKKQATNVWQNIRNKLSPTTPAVIIPESTRTNVHYVALGDSFAAGVGSGGGALKSQHGDLDLCCFRNRNGYPSLLARAIGARTLDYRACAGAVTLEGLNSVALQMQYASRNAELVTVTVGGNDMGYGDVVVNCFTSVIARKPCFAAMKRANRRLPRVGRNIRKLSEHLSIRFPKATIVFTGYPQGFAAGGSKRTNKLCHPISIQRSINRLIRDLNTEIRVNVPNFVPISFVGRELCNHRKPWIIGNLKRAVRVARKCSLGHRVFKQVGGLYHITNDGQVRYKQQVLSWYMKRRQQK